MQTALTILDWTFFLVLGLSTLYLFVFALFSIKRREYTFPEAKCMHRFVTLIPAYKGDAVVGQTVEAALNQHYPAELHRVVVIADHCEEQTLQQLAKQPITLLTVNFENSSKAKALNYAIDHLAADAAEVVTILDVDNRVDEEFIHQLNNAYDSGAMAMQAHRTAANRNTDTAVLDAVSEEINNSIFRRGHITLGISSALIGSGMAFDYRWFRDNIARCTSAGEDKELETLLLRQNIFIEYLDHVVVLDEKVEKDGAFYNQRRRWLAAQFYSLVSGLRDLPVALLSGNIDYCDKLIQWMMPPRILLLGLIPLWAVGLTLLAPLTSIKWWGLLLLLLFAFAFAIPDAQMDDKLKRALRKIPRLFVLMGLNMFRLRGAKNTFIHTTHTRQ
ncbi:MAG: glycosyltransferase [Alistipes sp.]